MNIDEMLSQPLPPVADNGFSAGVERRIRRAERWKLAGFGALAAAAVTLLAVLLPVQDIAVQINLTLLKIGTSATLGTGAAALFLTLFADRQIFRT